MNQTPKQIAIPIIQQKFNNKQTVVTLPRVSKQAKY